MADRQVRAFQGGVTKAVGDRQVRVIMSSPRPDRHGDVVDIAGIDLTEYRRNPVVLWQHDHDEPIARCVEVGISGTTLQAVVQFPPEGTSEDADEAYRLVKAGIVSAVSIGFIPKEGGWSYIDQAQPWAGYRYTSIDLLELSFVSVPANPDALVIERSALRHRKAEEMLLDAAVQQIGVMKAGRVLSRANEDKLRAAHDAIGEVLAQVEQEAAAAKPKTLYVKRPVLNGAEIRAWAQQAGFPSSIPPEEMHVTVAFSKAALDWTPLAPQADQVVVSGGERGVMPLGDKGAVVLRLESQALAARWAEFRAAGASWDFESYKPHVTLTYAGGVDAAAIEAFAGDIVLGAEVFAEVNDNWVAGLKELPFFAPCAACPDASACEAASACIADRQKAARLRSVAARLRIAGLAA